MTVKYAFLSVVILAILATSGLSAEKLPAAQAGQIGKPLGWIAFARQKSVWVMNADGTNQHMVSDVRNADGRMSWAPDNRRIAFTRSGSVNLQGPDMLGGVHKVYDIFIAYLDSAEATQPNTMFWRRLTGDVGSRDPQWLSDNRIMCWKDMNANLVNAGEPNYQIVTMDDNGENIDILRKDWRNPTAQLTSPSISSIGNLACVYFENARQQGMVVIPKSQVMMAADSLRTLASKMPACVGPAWSPDGQWLAYVKNDINAPGLFITTPDLSKTYLVFEPPVGASLYTVAPSFSADSKWLTFATTDGSVWICDITGNSARRLTGPGLDQSPAWSNGTSK